MKIIALMNQIKLMESIELENYNTKQVRTFHSFILISDYLLNKTIVYYMVDFFSKKIKIIYN